MSFDTSITVLISLLQLYKKVKVNFLAELMNVNRKKVEADLLSLEKAGIAIQRDGDLVQLIDNERQQGFLR